MKKVYLIHGWEGSPKDAWFPQVQEDLSKAGYEVEALSMPDPINPDPITWPEFLNEKISEPGADTYLIGHSIGCQTIMRYLEKLPAGKAVGGVVFVAPYFSLPFLQTQEEKDIWKKWQDIPIDITEVKNKTKHIVSIFSDNDPDVDHTLEIPVFRDKLGSAIVLEHNKGHFSDDAGIKELPSVVEAILSF